MCFSQAKWKREKVADHKFDFVDVREFHDSGFFTQLRYMWLYILVLKSFLVYVADLYTAIAMLASNQWSGQIIANAGDHSVVQVPFKIGKWIFCGAIIVSFLLLLWEARKARLIIRSRDISYSFTNVMANDYYCLKSYDHFCFFSEISNSKKRIDDFAFFVFFTFKGWKRLLLADAPRQVINGLTLYAFLKAYNFTTDVSKYTNGSIMRALVLITMTFTVIVCAGSLILLLIAGFAYIPLLCHIRGNLKEYCCHKVDKRIDELMKRKARSRQAQEAARIRKEAAGDFSHLRDKRGKVQRPLEARPTLPHIALDDEEMYAGSDTGSRSRGLDRYAGGGGEKDAAYYYADGAPTYPPHQLRYELSDGPAPQHAAAYAASEYSLASHDRPGMPPRDYSASSYDERTAPLIKAPSYRSDDEHWQQQQSSAYLPHQPAPPPHDRWGPAPPVPPLPDRDEDHGADPYGGYAPSLPAEHGRRATEDDYSQYDPIRRTALFQRAGRQDDSAYYGHAAGQRPASHGSAFSLDDYHRREPHR